MTFRFIHTGDWHLAKPFGRFDADKQTLLREARQRIVERVGQLARRERAGVVLVAGDVFDSPLVGDDVLRRLAARLGQFADISWHFLPGNHDPSTANGVWQRFAEYARADHIVIHHEAGLYQLAEGVDLLVAPLKARAISHDPTAWMSDCHSPAGTIRIGLAHGSIHGFGSANEASVQIAPDRAEAAKLDYLALGDWHGVRRINQRTWYAGTPEPDHFPDNEPGFALSVQVPETSNDATPIVERHNLAQYRWQRQRYERNSLVELQVLERTLSEDEHAADTLLSLDLAGEISLDDELAIRRQIAMLADLTFHVEAKTDRLVVDKNDAGLGGLEDPLLARVAARLASMLEEPNKAVETMTGSGVENEGRTAHQALLLLSEIARRRDAA